MNPDSFVENTVYSDQLASDFSPTFRNTIKVSNSSDLDQA